MAGDSNSINLFVRMTRMNVSCMGTWDLKIINEIKRVVQVTRAAQGLSKVEIILDYMSVERALRAE